MTDPSDSCYENFSRISFIDALFINNSECCILGEFTGHGHA